MALSGTTTFEPNAAELINLNKILENCNVPDVGLFSLQPEISTELHYCFALDRFETTSRVFDKLYYEEDVLSVVMSEEKLDEILIKDAKAKGVPESHFPPKRRRNRPMRSQAPLLSPLNIPRVYESSPSPVHPSITFSEAQKSIIEGGLGKALPLSPRKSHSSRPSLTLSNSDKSNSKGMGAFRIPTAANSVVSFMSGSSQSSWSPQKQQKRRRDSLMQFFRRGSSSNSLISDRKHLSPHEEFSPPSIAEVPELTSPHSHESQDLSSLQSLSVSTRTSTSSFMDSIFSLSTPDHRAIILFKKTEQFRVLQIHCDGEVLRFNDFAQHQRVALPLILGRHRVYSDDRRKARLAELKKKHAEAIEQMENRHVEREMTEMERHRLAIEDSSARNATALKYVKKRLSLLGDDATPGHHMRLEEEITAMDRLAARHEREISGLIRNQDREKLDLQRQQEKEVDDYHKSLEDEMHFSLRTKLDALEMNMVKLDDLIEDRKARLVARWFLRLQIAKMEVPETAHIKAPLPLTVLDLPPGFANFFPYP